MRDGHVQNLCQALPEDNYGSLSRHWFVTEVLYPLCLTIARSYATQDTINKVPFSHTDVIHAKNPTLNLLPNQIQVATQQQTGVLSFRSVGSFFLAVQQVCLPNLSGSLHHQRSVFSSHAVGHGPCGQTVGHIPGSFKDINDDQTKGNINRRQSDHGSLSAPTI